MRLKMGSNVMPGTASVNHMVQCAAKTYKRRDSLYRCISHRTETETRHDIHAQNTATRSCSALSYQRLNVPPGPPNCLLV